MRVLSIGRPLPHPAIDNHTIFNAPTLFDYDAIVIDPGGVLDAVQQVIDGSAAHVTYADVPVINGETGVAVTGAADVLRRRRDEVARALERGAAIVVFGYPPATLSGVSGFSGCDRYFFLPAPPGLGWDATLLRGGEGTGVVVADPAHPFAAVIEQLRAQLLYRAYFDERARGFAGTGRVFARTPGGAPLGVQFAIGGGTVVFLPLPRADAYATPLQGGAFVQALSEMLAVDAAPPPGWLEAQPVPGLEALDGRIAAARERAADAGRSLAELEQQRAQLAALRDVLWREGDRALLPAVQRCLWLLGFESSLIAGPALLRAPEGELLLEVAASDEAVRMAPHYRLRRRLDELIERERRAGRGLLVVNGQRLNAPAERGEQFDDSLRVAAESSGYALLTVTELFAAARSALDGAEASTLAAMRTRLLGGAGAVALADLAAPAAALDAAPAREPVAAEGVTSEGVDRGSGAT